MRESSATYLALIGCRHSKLGRIVRDVKVPVGFHVLRTGVRLSSSADGAISRGRLAHSGSIEFCPVHVT